MTFTFNQTEAQVRLQNLGYDVAVDGKFGAQSFAALLAYVGARGLCQMHRDLGVAMVQYLPVYQIESGLRVALFLGQSAVETGGFTRLVENLNYSAQRMHEVWPKRFPTVASAQPYDHNPEALANKVYGGRFGNVNPGDGWKFRGRGLKQTTFHDNYKALQDATGLNVIDDPDQLADPVKGTIAGCVYWKSKGCNSLADQDNILEITHRVNGGENGLPERKNATARAKKILL